LGPEADVEVDAHSHAGKDGDIYLLCSDGLTGMISEEEIAAILRGSGTLEQAATDLVRAANQSGGKDNITVVLFRLAEDAVAHDTAAQGGAAIEETVHQGLTAEDVRTAVSEQERSAVAAPPAPAPTPPRVAAPQRPVHASSTARRGRLRRALGLLVTLAVLAAIGLGMYAGARQVYFLGTDEAGLVTLYRGLPYELPMGVELYSQEYTSSVPSRTVPRVRRERLLDHEWRSQDDAQDLVRQLEEGTLDTGRASE
jgi:protein phosphatase